MVIFRDFGFNNTLSDFIQVSHIKKMSLVLQVVMQRRTDYENMLPITIGFKNN